ncbi:shikimate kinase [soil metagenome]
MSIVLIGYRGSGKTTIGRKLADRLGWPFVDSDAEVVKVAGKSIKAIFEGDGEPAFRDLESAVVADVSQLVNHVISLGGGAVMRRQNVAALRAHGHSIIYLRADAQTLHDRIHADAATAENRPALTALSGGIDEILHLLAVREPSYRAIMTSELDVARLTPDEAVERILQK